MKRPIKTTLWILLLFVLTGIAFWFVKMEFDLLKSELGNINSTENNFELTRSIATNLNRYENIVAQLSTPNDSLQNILQAKEDTLHTQINSLKEFTAELSYNTTVDSVAKLFLIYAEQTKAYLLLKNKNKPDAATSMKQMVDLAEDSLMKDTAMLNLIRNNSVIMMLEKPIFLEGSKKKVKKLKEQMQDTLAIKEIYREEETVTDSILVKRLESVFNNMQAEIKKLRRNNALYEKRISSEELLQSEYRNEIYITINNLLNKIRTDEQATMDAHISTALQKSEKAMNALFAAMILVGIVALFFMLNLGYDLTKSYYYQQQLQQEKNRAEMLANARQQFLSHMSHEIRTPLNAIMGFTTLLATNTDDNSKKTFLNKIKGASAHLLALVNNILDFSKLKAGNLKPTAVIFSPEKIVEEVAAVMQVLASEKQLYLKTEIQIDHIKIKGDELWLKQILFNLLGNAIKFTEKGGITLQLSGTNINATTWQLTANVTDTGSGIPLSLQHKLFQPFEAGDEYKGKRQTGTGLGLSITKELIELQGGSIALAKTDSSGTTFSFNIPYVIIEHDDLQNNSLAVAKQLIQHKNILVVEDDMAGRILITTLLKSWGATVTECTNAEEGLQKLNDREIDLVICDQNLDKMKGSEMVQQYHITHPEAKTKFIISSAERELETAKLSKDIAIKLLPKPYSPHELALIIIDYFKTTTA